MKIQNDTVRSIMSLADLLGHERDRFYGFKKGVLVVASKYPMAISRKEALGDGIHDAKIVSVDGFLSEYYKPGSNDKP